ncbi:hypothetical protein BSU04_38940 [Caballeronia sordidicola]|uniref:Uncharacterized protein n=1 Tax=Caballeronia sordidicola TaxID=196367 RepID=A0A226WPC9_CABSO|nr:hypothetical protein BSU04_38940 [Caballeronia sordidicola]
MPGGRKSPERTFRVVQWQVLEESEDPRLATNIGLIVC